LSSMGKLACKSLNLQHTAIRHWLMEQQAAAK